MTTPGTGGLTWESTRHQRRLQPASGADPAGGAGRAGSPQTCLSSLASSQPTGAPPSCRSAGGSQRCPPRAPAAAADGLMLAGLMLAGLMLAGIAGARGGPAGRGGERARAPFSDREHRGPSAGAAGPAAGSGRQGPACGDGRAAPRPAPAPAPPQSPRPVHGCRPPPGSPRAVTNAPRAAAREGSGSRAEGQAGAGNRRPPRSPPRSHHRTRHRVTLASPGRPAPAPGHLARGERPALPQGAPALATALSPRRGAPPPPWRDAGRERRAQRRPSTAAGRRRPPPPPIVCAARPGGPCPAPSPAPRPPPGPPRPDVTGPHWRPPPCLQRHRTGHRAASGRRRVYSGHRVLGTERSRPCLQRHHTGHRAAAAVFTAASHQAPGTERPPHPERERLSPGPCHPRVTFPLIRAVLRISLHTQSICTFRYCSNQANLQSVKAGRIS